LVQVNENTDSPDPLVFDTELPIESFIGFTGGPLCSTDYPGPGGPALVCGSPVYQHGLGIADLEYGALEPATPTTVPEPSTFALVATGILGLAGTTCQKIRLRMSR